MNAVETEAEGGKGVRQSRKGEKKEEREIIEEESATNWEASEHDCEKEPGSEETWGHSAFHESSCGRGRQ